MKKQKFYLTENGLLISDKDDDFEMFKEYTENYEKLRYHGKIVYCQCPSNLNLSQLCNLRNEFYRKPETDSQGNLKNDNLRTTYNQFKNSQVKWFWKDGVAIEVSSLAEFKKEGGWIRTV